MRTFLIGLMLMPMVVLADVIWTPPDAQGCKWGYELVDGKAVIREHTDRGSDWSSYECGIAGRHHLGALVIPSDLRGYPVVSVELSDQPYVTEVFIPETVTNVTSLGVSTYPGRLKKVVITNVKTIGDGCFNLPSLESIELPTTVERFGSNVFYEYGGAYSLTNLTYDVSLEQWLNVELVDFGSSPFCLYHHHNASFMDKLNGVLRIPDHIREIRQYQFSSIANICRLEIGPNVAKVGGGCL